MTHMRLRAGQINPKDSGEWLSYGELRQSGKALLGKALDTYTEDELREFAPDILSACGVLVNWGPFGETEQEELAC